MKRENPVISIDMNGKASHKLHTTYDNEWIKLRCLICDYEVWINRETYEPKRISGKGSPFGHASGLIMIPAN